MIQFLPIMRYPLLIQQDPEIPNDCSPPAPFVLPSRNATSQEASPKNTLQ